MFKYLKISSPGKIILCGEHSVVYGKKALACAINLRTTLTASYSDEDKFRLKCKDINKEIEIREEDFELIKSTCSSTDPDEIIHILEANESDKIIGSIKFFILLYTSIEWPQIKGLTLEINSELPIASGLGSSASYSTCLSAFFLLLLTKNRTFLPQDYEKINKNAFYIEKLFHGKPSGLDNSVSTYGNYIVFEKGQVADKFTCNQKLNVLIINSGVPKKTVEQVKKVRILYEKNEEVLESLMNTMDILVKDFISILKHSESSDKLKDLITINQGLLYSLQVSSQELNLIVNLSQKFGFHSKITGAGGGGCCITLLDINEDCKNRVCNLMNNLKENNFIPFKTELGCEGVRVDELSI